MIDQTAGKEKPIANESSDDLRGVDLSHIADEDLTPAQKDELARRFKRFFRVLYKNRQEQKKHKKTLRKWIPGQDN